MSNPLNTTYDALVIGAGPNGLSAGIRLVNAGLKVLLVEATNEVGGGTKTAQLTLAGYHHDICSAVHPIGYLSPFFKTLNLENYGLEWCFPEASVAHPLDGEEAVMLSKSLAETAANLGVDAKAYQDLVRPFIPKLDELLGDILKPIGIPKHPILMARFGSKAILPATTFANLFFKEKRAKALFAGCAAHSILPFNKTFTAALGLLFLVTGHAVNWPVIKGGSKELSNALLKIFQTKGGELLLETQVKTLAQLPKAKAYLFNTDPHQLAKIAKEVLPSSYLKKLNSFHFGPGVFKIDYALSEPIPWKDPNCSKASTVHLGGTIEEIARGEQEAWNGIHSEKPYVLVAQQSQFDTSRAPKGKHTCWAYCHVPAGSDWNMSKIIENQIERFAPGFKDIILAKHTMNTQAYHQHNLNYVGGAVTGGAANISQLFARPALRVNPYSTPNPNIFICSASSPPGGGVHGMCGYNAAVSVLGELF